MADGGCQNIRAGGTVQQGDSADWIHTKHLMAPPDVLAQASGHWGTGAEYLLIAVTHLEQKGIADNKLWRLQRSVAERIDAIPQEAG